MLSTVAVAITPGAYARTVSLCRNVSARSRAPRNDGSLRPVESLSPMPSRRYRSIPPPSWAKRAALRAHATQLTVSPSGREFALTNMIAQPILPEEHFVLARGRSVPRGAAGRADDR